MSKADNTEPNRYETLRKQRRFVVVPVDINLFGEMLLSGNPHYKAEGLPKDAIFVQADRDIQQQAFQFIYLHESFEPVPEGATGPIAHVSLTRLGGRHPLDHLLTEAKQLATPNKPQTEEEVADQITAARRKVEPWRGES
jgi:hypothetical protein